MLKKRSVQGKKNRAAGARFELRVRKELEDDGWIVDKWTNNVDLETKKLIKCKPKFNPFTKSLMMNTPGFPDFIVLRKKGNLYEVRGVEVKANGWLDKIEKEKAKFLLSKNIFNRMVVAKKGKKRGDIEYVEFE